MNMSPIANGPRKSAAIVSSSAPPLFIRLGVALLLFIALSLSASIAAAAEPRPLFDSHDILQVRIEAPIAKIMKDRDSGDDEDGVFTLIHPDGNEEAFDIQVEVRGRFRAREDVCDFAPLRINFKKKQVRGTLFKKQDKLKLVTHCQNAKSVFEQYLLKEYLSYRFLEALTEKSFRTRLMQIEYVDSEGRSKTRKRYGFFIEDSEELAKRLGAMQANIRQIEFDNRDQEQTNLVTVFGHFLGNTDFSAIRGADDDYCCHNVELVELVPGVLTPVPYDFDFAGMVDAPYAAPGPNVGIRKVTTRRYRGLCRNNDILPATLDKFRGQNLYFAELVSEQEGLNGASKRQMRNYIQRFFDVLSDESSIKSEFLDHCSNASRPRDPT